MKDTDGFWDFVEKGDGCWLWKRSFGKKGYGQVHINGKHKVASRVAWELTFGPIPDRLFVLHRCDNPPCCRPDHLFLGTNSDNMRDMQAKGRQNYNIGPMIKARRKLTLDQVHEIRAIAKDIPLVRLGRPKKGAPLAKSIRGLARKYGVEHNTIRQIINNNTWREYDS